VGSFEIISEYIDLDVQSQSSLETQSGYISVIYHQFPRSYSVTLEQKDAANVNSLLAPQRDAEAISFNLAHRHKANFSSKFELHFGSTDKGKVGAFTNSAVIPEDRTVIMIGYALNLVF